jgi:hypothetical protein
MYIYFSPPDAFLVVVVVVVVVVGRGGGDFEYKRISSEFFVC